MSLRRLALFALAVSLSACANSRTLFSSPGAAPVPKAGDVSSLVRDAGSAEDASLVDLMNRATNVAFPTRLGVLFLNYSDPLKVEDQESTLDALGKDLVATGLVRSVTQIPKALVNAGDSTETIRATAARFQVDLLLIISGTNDLTRAPDQPTGLFSNGVAWESRAKLSGLALGIYSGTYLTPYEVAGKAGPVTIDPADPSAQSQQYQIRRDAQKQALEALKNQFKDGLAQLKQTQDAATPAPSPSPTASPSPAPSASPSPSPSPSPTP